LKARELPSPTAIDLEAHHARSVDDKCRWVALKTPRHTRFVIAHELPVWNPELADEILNIAGQQQLYLMTTEKDMARIQGNPALADLAKSSTALPVTMSFDSDTALPRQVIDRFLSMAHGAAGTGYISRVRNAWPRCNGLRRHRPSAEIL
jgi:hypothetical protein